MQISSGKQSRGASVLEQELREQATVLATRSAQGEAAAAEAADLIRARNSHYLLIAARGSSDNAARFAQYALGAEARLSAALAAPSLFTDAAHAPDLGGAAVLGISQSGRSPDLVAVLAAARAQGRPTIAVTNDEGSPLAAHADVVVPLAVGEERSVAATKTYVASLHAVVQIVQGLQPSFEREAWLERLPALVEEAVEDQLRARARFDVLDGASYLTAVGRRLNLATAHETALKIRELAGMVTEAFSPPDLLHGPIAALREDGALWLIDGPGDRGDSVAAVLDRVHAASIRTIIVSADPELCATADLGVALPADAPGWVTAILAVLPAQAAALRLAESRGVEVDRPHGLTKVTLTR
jgi:glutamine---fructose-6-phosphate transaminase (isomerizing)